MAEKSRIGRSKSGSERDLGAGNGKPALVTATQLLRLRVGGALLRVLTVLENIDADLRPAVGEAQINGALVYWFRHVSSLPDIAF